MSKPKHTPGPWGVDETDDTYFIGGADCLVAQIEKQQSGQPGDPKEQAANVRLIAVSPDMLAALQELDAWDKEGRDPYSRNYVLELARAAILKATGGEE